VLLERVADVRTLLERVAELMLIPEVEEAELRRVGWDCLQLSVLACKAYYDGLSGLFRKWPNAEFFLYGQFGWYKGAVRPFYTKIYPTVFPTAPVRVPWKTFEWVTGNTWCGLPHAWDPDRRLRLQESAQALDTWDLFQGGLSPTQIAQRQRTSGRGQGKSDHASRMTVLRRLDRAHRLIYGTCLPADWKKRLRLIGFDPKHHREMCTCLERATRESELCPAVRDYLNQDDRSGRERLVECSSEEDGIPDLDKQIPNNTRARNWQTVSEECQIAELDARRSERLNEFD